MFRPRRRFASQREPHAGALAALARGEFADAEDQLTALLAPATREAERAFLLNKRGVARVGLGNAAAAREDFEAALACVANYPPALTNLGNLSLEAGDVESAIARYQAAIAADEGYALAHLNLGAAYKRAGRFAEAVAELRRAQRFETPSGGSGRRRS